MVGGFTGGMHFITDQGLRAFSEFQHSDIVRVLNKHGLLTNATIREQGRQEEWEICVARNRVRHFVCATRQQLWPMMSEQNRFRGDRPQLLRTDQLLTTNKKFITVNPNSSLNLDTEGILHGIVFGDGARHKPSPGRKPFCQIYLCNNRDGADSRNLAGLFEQAGYKPVARSDQEQIRFYGLPEQWKTLPDESATPEYLRGFISGWFAADGRIDSRGSSSISSSNKEHLSWLQTVAPKAGLATSTRVIRSDSISTFGPVTWYVLSLVKETLDETFFLLESKRRRFQTAKHTKYWKVVDIRPTRSLKTVYSLNVSNEQMFVLEGNILTCGYSS